MKKFWVLRENSVHKMKYFEKHINTHQSIYIKNLSSYIHVLSNWGMREGVTRTINFSISGVKFSWPLAVSPRWHWGIRTRSAHALNTCLLMLWSPEITVLPLMKSMQLFGFGNGSGFFFKFARCVCASICACKHVQMCLCMCVHTYIHKCACLDIHMVHIYMHTYKYIWI